MSFMDQYKVIAPKSTTANNRSRSPMGSRMSTPGSRASTTGTRSRSASRTFIGRHDPSEMSKEQVLETRVTFHNVRRGGPKEKRLRRVELMGEHTPKPLHWVKVTQDSKTFKRLLDPMVIEAEFEERVGDVGDAYRPIDPETKEPFEYAFVGFFRKVDMEAAISWFRSTTIAGVDVSVEEAKVWFIDLYPKPVMFATACSADEDEFLLEIGECL